MVLFHNLCTRLILTQMLERTSGKLDKRLDATGLLGFIGGLIE